MAQIAKQEALRALIESSESDRQELMQRYEEADKLDKEACLQIAMDEINNKAEIEKHKLI